jgi:hypothetical protein
MKSILQRPPLAKRVLLENTLSIHISAPASTSSQVSKGTSEACTSVLPNLLSDFRGSYYLVQADQCQNFKLRHHSFAFDLTSAFARLPVSTSFHQGYVAGPSSSNVASNFGSLFSKKLCTPSLQSLPKRLDGPPF